MTLRPFFTLFPISFFQLALLSHAVPAAWAREHSAFPVPGAWNPQSSQPRSLGGLPLSPSLSLLPPLPHCALLSPSPPPAASSLCQATQAPGHGLLTPAGLGHGPRGSVPHAHTAQTSRRTGPQVRHEDCTQGHLPSHMGSPSPCTDAPLHRVRPAPCAG